MKTISILEGDDRIAEDDWCRPLRLQSMSGGMSDSYSFKSCYSGTPENNVEWCMVKYVFGEVWFGKTVSSIAASIGPYEFVRGDVPRKHRLDMREYNTTIYKKGERYGV